MFKLTPAAAKQIQVAAKEGDMQGLALRIAVKKDESGAFEYGMGFDKASDEDAQINSEGVDIVISPADIELLRDTTMDYVEIEAGKFHFIFMNPNDPNYVPPKSQN